MTYEKKIKNKLSNYDNISIISSKPLFKSNSKIELFCKKHNFKFKIECSKILESKYICKKCAIQGQKINQQIRAYNEFINKSKKIFGENRFKYLSFIESKYQNNHSKVKLICSIHGEFECEASSHLRSKTGACPDCTNQSRSIKQSKNKKIDINKNNWIKVFRDKFGNKFDYSKFEYRGRNKKGIIICPIHGEFEQTPNSHINSKSGCIECSKYNQNKITTWTTDKFIKLAKELFPQYNYSLVRYINSETKVKIKCPTHGIFEIRPKQLVFYKQGCSKCKTKAQNSISKYIQEELHIETKYNNRTVLNGKEIDIFIPSHNLGIEYNGLLFHSFGKTYPNNIEYLNKTVDKIKKELAQQEGVDLLFIWENEWIDNIKQKIWKSLLKNKLRLIQNVIYARKCSIKEISNDIYKEFVEHNHLQGYAVSNIRLGLFYKDELIAVMSFSKPRYSNYQYELIRFCSKVDYRIVGGASKLLRYFERKYKPRSIISYANKRWSNGNLYHKLGFNLVKESDPNYWYIDSKMNLYSRTSFQKHMLKDKLENYDKSKSELENMIDNEYRIIYDCGNYVFVKQIKT